MASAHSAPSASQAPWTTSPPHLALPGVLRAGRLQIPGENLHALRRPSRWFGSLDDQKAVGRRRPVGLMVGRVRGSTPRGGTAGGPLGSSVVGSPSSSCRGPRGCVGEQPTARRAPRIAPACFPRVIPAPPSSPPAPPLLPLTLPSFWQTFCLLNVDFFSFYMVAQGASPVPVPVPPTLALRRVDRRPSGGTLAAALAATGAAFAAALPLLTPLGSLACAGILLRDVHG